MLSEPGDALLRIRRYVWSDGVLPIAIDGLLVERGNRLSGDTRFLIAVERSLTAAEILSIMGMMGERYDINGRVRDDDIKLFIFEVVTQLTSQSGMLETRNAL